MYSLRLVCGYLESYTDNRFEYSAPLRRGFLLRQLHITMAVKSKTGAHHIEHRPGRPKTTAQGQGQHSRPERKGKKKNRGQG